MPAAAIRLERPSVGQASGPAARADTQGQVAAAREHDPQVIGGNGRMSHVKTVSMLMFAALLAGCTSSASRDTPAVLTNPTPATTADLRLAVQRALHSDPILLAPDALTKTNVLSIDRFVRR